MPERALPSWHRESIRIVVTTLALLVLVAVAWDVRILILLTMLGALLGVAATPAVDWLERHRVRRSAGAPLVIFGLIAVMVGVIAQSGPTLATQVQGLRVQIPAALDQLDGYLAREYGPVVDAILPRDTATAAVDSTTTGASTRLRRALAGQIGSARALLFGALSSTVAGVGAFIYVVFLTVYFAIAPGTYRRGLLFLVPVERRARAALVFDAVIATLRVWLQTQLIAMLAIGSVTMVVLWLLDVKSAIPLGIIAGVLEFVPNVGPLLAAIPAVIIAFADSPEKALAVTIAYWAIQFLENNLLIPYLMQEELDLPPAVTLLWQALMAVIFGFLGLFVAVPLLAALMVAVRMLYVRGEVPPPSRLAGSRTLTALDDGAEAGSPS